MWNIFVNRCYQRLAYLNIISACIVLAYPSKGLCEDTNRISHMLTQVENLDSESLVLEFDQLDSSFEKSSDSFSEGHKFLQSFIAEINVKYNLNLTIIDACNIAEQNLGSLDLSEEVRKTVLNTIQAYKNCSSLTSGKNNDTHKTNQISHQPT